MFYDFRLFEASAYCVVENLLEALPALKMCPFRIENVLYFTHFKVDTCPMWRVDTYLIQTKHAQVHELDFEQIVASELKDPLWHSLEWQIGSFSSEATKCAV